ncbi:hypothetical protein HF521_004879 [Silurus meridionalis]|uniref:Ig-like domain-containing protein n=1 Tax=Silurus meridionalis TaxID=175797 RepID=A0A8T0AXY5_SILME|nr:hypothetical protein HF521_004879 [Silurus meridionalis]
MILSSAERNDSGTYMLDTFDEEGTAADSYILQLRIEAEVTTVNLWYTCLSSEGMKVYCSADGDNITYSWTSNLHPLAQLENGTNNHTLSKEHNGKVTCFIENHVSHHHNTTVLHQCSSESIFY